MNVFFKDFVHLFERERVRAQACRSSGEGAEAGEGQANPQLSVEPYLAGSRALR